MRPHLRRALDPVLRDLVAAGVPGPRFDDVVWQTASRTESCMLRWPDGSGVGLYVDLDRSEAERTADVADQLQDSVVETFRDHTSWPPCPDHPANHPMTAVVVDGSPRWACPATGRAVAVVGRWGER